VRSLALLLICGCSLCAHTPLRSDMETASEAGPAANTAGMRALATEFFEWRRVQQPASGDDIPRVERPDGWIPDFSPAALESYRARYPDYLNAVDGLDTRDWDVTSRVDARLLRAAIQRVHWELDVLPCSTSSRRWAACSSC
jgi:hypothetical protein